MPHRATGRTPWGVYTSGAEHRPGRYKYSAELYIVYSLPFSVAGTTRNKHLRKECVQLEEVGLALEFSGYWGRLSHKQAFALPTPTRWERLGQS